MGDIKERVLCAECPFNNLNIKTEGCKFGVEYVVLSGKTKTYLIQDNPNVSWDDVMKNIRNFDTIYVPKFGKYEIEQFVGDCMRQAIFFTKDITDLLNTELLCDDSPYNITRFKAEIVKLKVLKCFKVLKEENNTVYLEFKWKKYNELD